MPARSPDRARALRAAYRRGKLCCMQRVTATLPESLLAELDRFAEERRYTTRSEALRDLLRAALRSDGAADGAGMVTGEAMGVLSYVYDHHRRDLAGRLMRHHHDHHTLSVTTSHVHLDHDTCLETAILRGPVAALRAYADGVLSQRGVTHGSLFLIPVETRRDAHAHGQEARAHDHLHVRERF